MTVSFSEEDYQRGMERGWQGGLSDGTKCGSGSTMASTANLRAALPRLLQKYSIRSISDAGAGDLHWIEHVALPEGIEYRAFDLVPRHKMVERADIRSDLLPPADLIICRHTLEHMLCAHALQALALLKQSARYLLLSTHKGAHKPELHYAFNKWDLIQPPFSLGEPHELIAENKPGYFIGLWGAA